MNLPEGLDWWVMRIAASEKFSSSLVEIQSQWTMYDVVRAHQTLDALQDAEHRASKASR